MLLILLSLIFVPIVFAIGIYITQNVKFNRLIFVLQAMQSALFLRLLYLWSKTGTIAFNLGGWLDGIAIELKLGDINMLFFAMVTISFWYVALYVWEKRKNDHKFLFFTFFLQGSLYAMFCVNDLFTMYILLELNTIISSILIIYKKDGEAIRAGFYYLIYNSLAMSIYFLGVIIMYIKFGTLNITMITANAYLYQSQTIFKFAIGLFISAFAMKSAIVPLFSWLPIAHSSAPSSISALLSGLIVKTGVYGLIMTLSIFNNKDLCNLLFVLGVLTSIIGFLYAITQLDIKKILAYHTVSQIGLIVIGISAYNEAANLGALLHIFNHFLFKSLLFLCAGAIISASSERNIKNIHSIFKKSKIISFGLIVGMLAITGMPFFNGYIGKSLIKAGDYMIDAKIIFHIINMGTVISFVKLSSILIKKKPEKLDEIDHLTDVLIGDLGVKEEDVFIVDGFKKASILYMSLLTIISYFGERVLFGSLPSMKYIFKNSNIVESMLIYMVYIILGVLIYKHVVLKFVKKERKYSGGFQEASAMFVVFIGVILGFVKYFV